MITTVKNSLIYCTQACELSANSEHTSFNGQLDWKKTDVHTDKETGQAGRDGERGEGGMTDYDTKGKLCRETAATLIHSMYSCTYCLYFFNCNSIIIKWVLFSSSYAFAAFCFHPYLILFLLLYSGFYSPPYQHSIPVFLFVLCLFMCSIMGACTACAFAVCFCVKMCTQQGSEHTTEWASESCNKTQL